MNNDIVFTGTTSSFDVKKKDFWVVKAYADAQGLADWTFGGDGDDEAYCIQSTSNGGYIVCGRTNSFGAGEYDCWVLKFNHD